MTDQTPAFPPFPIVAIGASAGGTEALQAFFEALPEGLGVAFVVLAHLHARTGHDFSQYKRPTVLRRLARRMQIHRQETLDAYYDFLRQNAEEAQALFDELLISVTTFFRDPKAWEALAEQVMPRLFEEDKPDTPLRVWVPGCATGEEAYTLAILLLEEAKRRGVWPEIQVFATDLDEGALATAREGHYPAAIEADVSEERLRRFFQREDDHYRVTEEVRDCVLFATHSLLRDPPFSRLDLISCRNLLIYLDRELQEKVFQIFRYALRPGGYLFLGASESAEGEDFRTLDKKYPIFQARQTPGETPHLPELLLAAPRTRMPAPHPRHEPPSAPAPTANSWRISPRPASWWMSSATCCTFPRRWGVFCGCPAARSRAR